MKLDIKTIITSVNTKKEKAGDKPGPMRSTLSLQSTVSVNEIAGLFAAESAFKKFVEMNWLEDGEYANSDIRHYPLEGEMIGATVSIKPFSGRSQMFSGCVLKDIKVCLGPNKTVAMEFKLQLPGVTPAQVGQLHSWEQFEVDVAASPAQGELQLTGDGHSSSAPEPDGEDDAQGDILDAQTQADADEDAAAAREKEKADAIAAALKNSTPAQGVH